MSVKNNQNYNLLLKKKIIHLENIKNLKEKTFFMKMNKNI